jgi:probable rRNA maturation factor
MNNKSLLEISGISNPPVSTLVLEHILNVFCMINKISDDSEVSLVFCTNNEMRKINRRFRGVDKTTDVLSFPAENSLILNSLSMTETKFLGEILIDTYHIAEHTETNEYYNEVLHAFIHGLLHLIGYDHINELQKKQMKDMEHNIMSIIRLDTSSE